MTVAEIRQSGISQSAANNNAAMAMPITPPEWAAALGNGAYQRALRLLRAAADPALAISITNDMLVYVLQAVGRFAEAEAMLTERAELERQVGTAALPAEIRAALEASDAIDRGTDLREITLGQAAAVLSQAVRQYRVVIVSEEHPHPEHRAFGIHLIPRLRAAGITHFALEANAQAPLDAAAQAGRIVPSTDGFAFEPQRAALLRAALAAGLPLVAFDMDTQDSAWLLAHPQEQFSYRERRMAEHIIERIFAREPSARVLVWVGHGHGQKGTRLKMMAQYLWELTGDEPFSTYQLTGDGRRPGVDVLIRHPPPTYISGRPDWLRTPTACPLAGTVDPSGAYLVQLHIASEGPGSTPLDQVLTDAGGAFELLAPPGDYLLRLWAPNEQLVHTRPISLRGPIADLRLTG